MKESIIVLGHSTTSGFFFSHIFDLKSKYRNVIYAGRDQPVHKLENVEYLKVSNDSKEISINSRKLGSLCQDSLVTLLSFAPIWVTCKFLETVLAQATTNVQFAKVLACSSSSSETKKYSFSVANKSIAKLLFESELSLSKKCRDKDIEYTILQPTMIYGDIPGRKDKNISKLVKFAQFTPFILVPYFSGLRQPLHACQLSEVALSILLDQSGRYKNTIQAFGGDETLTYEVMMKRSIYCADCHNLAKWTLIIGIPRKIYFLLAALVGLISESYLEAALRVCSDLSGFPTASSITSLPPQPFPVKKNLVL
jgi:hypothetical protein